MFVFRKHDRLCRLIGSGQDEIIDRIIFTVRANVKIRNSRNGKTDKYRRFPMVGLTVPNQDNKPRLKQFVRKHNQ